MIAACCAWACLFGFYLVLAGQASLDEGVAGAVCAGAAVAWWTGIRSVSNHTFEFDPDSWAAAWRACRGLPAATLAVAAILLKALVGRKAGEVVHQFYAHGRHSDPHDGGRRAIGVLAASFAPDSFVLRTPPERDELVVHTIWHRNAPRDQRWPI